MPENPIYDFLKANKLTDKDETTFLKEYADSAKAKELFSFFEANKLTDKSFDDFYGTYLKKKDWVSRIFDGGENPTNGNGLSGGLLGKAVQPTEREQLTNYLLGLKTDEEKKLSQPKAITTGTIYKKPENLSMPIDEKSIVNAQKKLGDIMYGEGEGWKDPMGQIRKGIIASDNMDDVSGYGVAQILTEKSLMPDGFDAKRALSSSTFSGAGKDNLTAETLRNRVNEYEKTVAPFRDINPQELTYLTKDKLYDAAIRAYANNNTNFKKQLEAAGIDINKEDISLSIGDNNAKRGQIMSVILQNPDLHTFLEKENPDLIPALKEIQENLIYDNKDYGKVQIANEISRDMQSGGYNKIDPIFNLENSAKKTGDITAEALYANDPKKLQFYRENKDDILNKLDAPSLFTGFAEAGKGFGRSILNTFTQPFTSPSKTMKEGWEKEASHVSADPKGLVKFLSDSGHALGFVASIGATGNVFGAAGLSPNAASMTSLGVGFLGDNLEQAKMKYPDSPVKQWTSALFNTGLFMAMGKNLFPAAKVEQALTKVQPGISKVIDNLASGSITREAARAELNTWGKKAIDIASEGLQKNLKVSAEMTGITILNKTLDRLMGMDDQTFQQFHPEGEEADTFKSMFLSNIIVNSMAAYGQVKAKNNIAKESIYEAATNPNRYRNIIESSEISKNVTDTKDMLDNLDYITGIKKDLDARGLSEKQKKDYLLNALKSKVLNASKPSSPDATLTRQYSERIKDLEEINQGILEGKDADEITTTAEQKSIDEKNKETEQYNKLVEQGHNAVTKLLEETDKDDKPKLKGIYRDIAKDNPMGFLQDIADQAFGMERVNGERVPSKSPVPELDLIPKYGADVVNAAKKLFPLETKSKQDAIQKQITDEMDVRQQAEYGEGMGEGNIQPEITTGKKEGEIKGEEEVLAPQQAAETPSTVSGKEVGSGVGGDVGVLKDENGNVMGKGESKIIEVSPDGKQVKVDNVDGWHPIELFEVDRVKSTSNKLENLSEKDFDKLTPSQKVALYKEHGITKEDGSPITEKDIENSPLQYSYDFMASSDSGKWNSANSELESAVQGNRKQFSLYKLMNGEFDTFKEFVDFINSKNYGDKIEYTERMKRADDMSPAERKAAVDSYNKSVEDKVGDKSQKEKDILDEHGLKDETEYSPHELVEKFPLKGVQKVIWDIISPIVKKLGIKVKFSSSRITEGFDGSNNPMSGEVLLRPSTLKNGRLGEVLVHEVVHSLTTKIISRVNSGVETGLTSKQVAAVKGLGKLYKSIKADNNLQNKYPVKDIFEFIAHLTNDSFVKELESKDRNFIQKVVDFISDILGLNNANELAKKYLKDIIHDGTFLEKEGVTVVSSDYAANVKGAEGLTPKQRLLEAIKNNSKTTAEKYHDLKSKGIKNDFTKAVEQSLPTQEESSGKEVGMVVGGDVVDNKTKQQLLDERLNKIKEIKDKAEGTREERTKRYKELVSELGDETAALKKLQEEINARAKKEIDKLPELPKTENEVINEKGETDFENIKKDLGFKPNDYKWGKSPMDEDMGDMLLSKDKEAVIFIKPNEVEVYDEKNDQTDTVNNGVKIELVSTREGSRGKGKAKEMIQKVTDWADKNGTDLYLDIAPQDKSTTESGLKNLYESFGFEFDGIHGKRKPQSLPTQEAKAEQPTVSETKLEVNEKPTIQEADTAAKQIEQPTSKESEAGKVSIEDNEGAAGGKPPTGEGKVETEMQQPGTELSFKGLQEVANEFGYEDVKSRDRVTDLEELENAKTTAEQWASEGKYQRNIDNLLFKIENKELVPTAKQRLILQQYLANESEKLRGITDKTSKEYTDQFEKVKYIKKVGQIARQEAGAALRIAEGRQSHPINDLVDATIVMEEANGNIPLSEKQKQEVDLMVKQYEERAKVAEQKTVEMEKKFAELQALKGIEKAKKSRQEYKSERDKIRQSIKDKWKSAGQDILSSDIPFRKQLAAISPDVVKLVKSYVQEGVTEFSEVVKKVHDFIKDFNPNIKEEDVVDMIAGKYDEVKETQADLIKKLNSIRDKKSAEAIKIRARIKAGDFAKKEPSVSWVNNPEIKKQFPKEYNEALDAITKREEAKLDFDIAVYKAQRAQRTKAKKGIDFIRALIATTKAVKSGIDDSAVMMQNIVAMIAHPRSAVKALKEHALDALSEKRFRRYLTELHNSPIWPLIEKSGLDITDPKSLKEQNKEEIFDNNLLNKDFKIGGKKFNVGKYVTRPFERAFTSLGNAMRVNMFTNISQRMYAEGKTFETHPEEFKSLARVLNTETGRGKLHTQIERASQLITAGIWSPRLMASRLNMLGLSELLPVVGGKPGYYSGLPPEIRKMAIADITKFLGAGVGLMLFAGSRGADVDDDPESPTFGTIKVGDKKYNAWGGFTPYAKTIFQGATGKRKINGQRVDITKGKLIANFFRSRLTPAASVTTNLLVGKDYSNKPVTVEGELINLTAPLSVSAIIDGLKKDGIIGILNQGIPSFVGIGVSDERDFQKNQNKPERPKIERPKPQKIARE